MPRSISDSASSSLTRRSSAPWGGPLRKAQTVQTLAQWKVQLLEKQYAIDPWPSDAAQEVIAQETGVEFGLAFQWFAERRAKSIGLQDGYCIADLPADCPREYMCWRLLAAEFMDPEQRALEIEKTQRETTTNAQLTGSEFLRPEMPPAEGCYQRGTNAPPERSLPITVGQFLQLQVGSPILQELLRYELTESTPQYTIVPEETPVIEDAVQGNEDFLAEYLIELDDTPNNSSSPTADSHNH